MMIKLPEQNTPRWLIFLIDIGICILSLAIAYAIRFDFIAEPELFLESEWEQLKWAFPIFILVRALSFYIGKTYQGIIRFTSTEDAKRLFITIAFGSAIFALISPLRFYFVDDFYFLPRPILILDFLITLFLMIFSRFVVKLFYRETMKKGKIKKKILVYGAGELGLIVKQVLERDPKQLNSIFAYIDDNSKKIGKRLEGKSIFSTDQLAQILKTQEIDSVIIGVLNPNFENKKRVVDLCLEYGVETLSIPPVESWINGEFKVDQIRKVKIEDLLGRKQIQLSIEKIGEELSSKKILVTGAAGSIGSEIVRQLLRFSPAQVIILDQAESPLYTIHNELKALDDRGILTVVIGDVRNKARMQNLFKTFNPNIVYHAAAYKHVPLMEENPSEAIQTNVYGTKILADLSNQFDVQKFVMISTDKAVNPTNVTALLEDLPELENNWVTLPISLAIALLSSPSSTEIVPSDCVRTPICDRKLKSPSIPTTSPLMVSRNVCCRFCTVKFANRTPVSPVDSVNANSLFRCRLSSLYPST